jgi:hypothetical protein
VLGIWPQRTAMRAACCVRDTVDAETLSLCSIINQRLASSMAIRRSRAMMTTRGRAVEERVCDVK